MERSCRDLFNDMAEHRSILENYRMQSKPRFIFTPKTGKTPSITWFVFTALKSFTLFTRYRPAMSFGNRKKLEDLFSSILLRFKKYHPSGNLKLNILGTFQSLKFRILMEKIFSISLKLNFTPNILGCYGLSFPFNLFFFTLKLRRVDFLSEQNLSMKGFFQ